MGNIINGVASEYEMPREPRLYESKLPTTGCNVPMPPVKQLRDETCEDCAKSDMCSIQEEFMRAYKDILEIEGRTNVFINTSVKCKKFLRKPSVNGIR
ncbi:MAG: hypothetical protein K0S41_4375 [Anaerocolumna sp.]|jgi:hypothetical protein|nr:hypothetical protein [Anaerocolumna sp.]